MKLHSIYLILSEERILLQVYKYYSLSLITKLLGVVSPHVVDMENSGKNIVRLTHGLLHRLKFIDII